MRLLLIDDEEVALQALRRRVDWLSYGFTEVLTAKNAAEAKAILAEKSVDLLLCDIEMPGENGLALLDYVRTVYPATEIIMLTCHAEFTYVQHAIRSKARDYLLKPVDYEELDNILRAFLRSRSAAAAKEKLNTIIERAKPTDDEDFSEERMAILDQYIDDHISDKIYVDDLAKLLHISDEHLMRTFKAETGQSITEYITGKRIKLASILLKETDHSVSFVSSCTGFQSSSYFTKVFRSITGYTPTEYRNLFQETDKSPEGL